MFPHDAGDIDNIVTEICKGKLQCHQVKERCFTFLSNVEVDLLAKAIIISFR